MQCLPINSCQRSAFLCHGIYAALNPLEQYRGQTLERISTCLERAVIKTECLQTCKST